MSVSLNDVTNELNAMKVSAMSLNNRDEQVSALLDGELDDLESRRILAQMGVQDDAKARWSEYALIGEAMRDQTYSPSVGFAARFRAALADEPTQLAPVPRVERRPAAPWYWLAAAATVAAIAWTVVGSVPEGNPGVPQMLATRGQNVYTPVSVTVGNRDEQWQTVEAIPYLAAHQDYAHAVIDAPEMHYTPVSLVEVAR